MSDDGIKKKILIIDDDKFLLDMYAMKFTERNFEVTPMTSAVDALEKIKEGYSPDICLVDVIMQGMDGFTFVKNVKDQGLCPDAAIIILSNLGQREDVEKGIALGADGYIIKASATPSEVVNKVGEIINNKR